MNFLELRKIGVELYKKKSGKGTKDFPVEWEVGETIDEVITITRQETVKSLIDILFKSHAFCSDKSCQVCQPAIKEIEALAKGAITT